MLYKTYYICHHCVNFITSNKFDLKRHFQNKSTCKSNSKYEYEEAIKISENKKIYLKKDEVIDRNNLSIYINETEETYEEEINHDDFMNYFYNEETQKYKCNDCLCEFSSKQLIENHLLHKKKCKKVRKINEEIQKEKINSIIQKCELNHIDLNTLHNVIDNYIISKK
jgi:hypothetical protein